MITLQNCCVMRYTTAGQILNIIAPREFIDFSYTTSCEDGLLSCGKFSLIIFYLLIQLCKSNLKSLKSPQFCFGLFKYRVSYFKE